MSQKNDQNMDKNPKVKKTINLEAHIDERLTRVCGHLGCSVHSYLVAKIGEAVSKDFVQFQLGNSMDVQQEFMRVMTQQLISAEESEDNN